jgi:hypothetical protein
VPVLIFFQKDPKKSMVAMKLMLAFAQKIIMRIKIMPNLLFSSQVTRNSVEKKIAQAKSLLADIEDRQKNYFLALLQKRISDFENELSTPTLNSSEKEQVLEQYSRFANTVYQCLERPYGAANSIYYYHRQYYYPVGINDRAKPDFLTQNILSASIALNLILLIGAIPVWLFNPIIGAMMILVALPLLFPSCFYLYVPDSPDTTKKKQEEITLFQEGAQLIRPDLVFDEVSEIDMDLGHSLINCPSI